MLRVSVTLPTTALAEIVALPAFDPVTNPAPVTVATVSFEDDQVTVAPMPWPF
jgi:hypothetical protein